VAIFPAVSGAEVEVFFLLRKPGVWKRNRFLRSKSAILPFQWFLARETEGRYSHNCSVSGCLGRSLKDCWNRLLVLP